MITEYDLDEAIAECQGKRNPDAQTCMKLAAFYTIKQHMFGDKVESSSNDSVSAFPSVSSYSYDAGDDAVRYDGDTDFARAIDGRKASEIWPIIDEIVDTLRVVNPRLYDAIMRKLG